MKLIPALLISAVLVTPAAAGSRIGWSDLDLGTTAGAQAFHERIDTAARRACRNARKPNSWISDMRNCKAAFHAEAVSLMPPLARARYLGALSRIEAEPAQ